MSLRLFDTATRQVRDFVPVTPGVVGIYVCGATPQASPHIGHMRAQVNYDVLRRWLERSGLAVTLVRNVTDIDDKILAKSAEAGRPWWAHAYRFEREFSLAYDALNVLPATYEPRATGHIIEMVALIETLLGRGHAYAAADGSGDVYFDVRSDAGYGSLTHQRLDDMAPAEDADPRGKRDPRDFALWKGAKPSEPETASWDAPWGRGRPGWHLECSAMAARYLGREFDIHGGGIDLRFPHHENEWAQSRAAGDPFARYWVHNAWVVAGGEKMSKSLGNTMRMETLLEKVSGAVVRYALATPHYRSNIEMTDESLVEARTAYERIEGFVRRAVDLVGDDVADLDLSTIELPEAFVRALDDDLGTPAAVAVLHDSVRAGNAALAALDKDAVAVTGASVRAMADVLGIDPLDPHWAGDGAGASAGVTAALDVLVQAALRERGEARAAKDWARADAIRASLTAAGITIEDTPSGARWGLEGQH